MITKAQRNLFASSGDFEEVHRVSEAMRAEDAKARVALASRPEEPPAGTGARHSWEAAPARGTPVPKGGRGQRESEEI
eukprot:1617389-Alexandrium_andersonii.AAC.1